MNVICKCHRKRFLIELQEFKMSQRCNDIEQTAYQTPFLIKLNSKQGPNLMDDNYRFSINRTFFLRPPVPFRCRCSSDRSSNSCWPAMAHQKSLRCSSSNARTPDIASSFPTFPEMCRWWSRAERDVSTSSPVDVFGLTADPKKLVIATDFADFVAVLAEDLSDFCRV